METRRGHSGAALLSRAAAGATLARTPTPAARTHGGAGGTRFQRRLGGPGRWLRRWASSGKQGQAHGAAERWVRGTGGAGQGRGRRHPGGRSLPPPARGSVEKRRRAREQGDEAEARSQRAWAALSRGRGQTAGRGDGRRPGDAAGAGRRRRVDRGRARAAVSVRCDSQERLPPRLRFVRLERGEAADAEKLGVSAPSGFQGRRHGRAAEPASPPAQTSSLDREFRCQGLCRAHPEPQELRPFPKSSHFPLSGQSPGPSQEIPVSPPLGTGRRPGSFFGRSTFTL